MKKVLDWITSSKIFSSSMRIGVGVSGGADSMALLHFLTVLSKKQGFDVVAINVDHSLRANSSKESKFVEDYCKKNKIEFAHKKVDVKSVKDENKWTTEQAARVVRYETFEMLEKEYGLDKLCLAHHKDDQAETVLMHIFRGSGLKGATGMEFVSRDRIVRPFLNITKDEIMQYVQKYSIPFINDESNEDEKFTRNFLRKSILPEIKKVYPTVVESLCAFAENIRKDENYISAQVPNQLLIKNKNEVKLLNEAVNLPESIFSRLSKRAFELSNVFADIESKHLHAIKDLFFLKSGSAIDLPHDLQAIKDYDGVTIKKKDKQKTSMSKMFELGEFDFLNHHIHCEKCDIPNFGDGNQYIDKNKVPFSAVFRTKKAGDMFAKLGTGTKKLVDYFTDKKIPARFRDDIILLCAGSNVLAVVGLDISEHVKIDDQTEEIVKISIKEKAK